MKKLIADFKAFITRGNVIDLAVGMIIGSAFTAIVNALSNQILKPLINGLIYWLTGGKSLENVYAFIHKATKTETIEGVEQTVVDLANSIYIDWGALISAIINFFLIAIVLFTIIRLVAKSRKVINESKAEFDKKTLNRAERKELKAAGVNIKDKKAVEAYFAKISAEAEAKKAEEEAKKKAEEEEAKANSAESLLKDIKNILLALQKTNEPEEAETEEKEESEAETEEKAEENN